MKIQEHDYLTFVRMAYQASNDAIRISVPDKVHFPHTTVYVRLRDQRTVELSPTPTKGAFLVSFYAQDKCPGSRELAVGPVKGIGPHFRMAPVHYSVEGKDLLIEIPEESERYVPRKRRHRSAALVQPITPPQRPHIQAIPAPAPAAAPVVYVPPPKSLMERVCLEGYGSQFLYDIPMDRMLELIDQLAPYRVKE